MSNDAHPDDFRHLLEQPRDMPVAATIADRSGGSASDRLALILNVDDHEPSRAERTRLVRASGYQVIEAESAAEALRVMTTRTVSLALINTHLSDSDGVALCETLKRLRQDVPVVLISASAAAPALRDAGRAAGAEDVLEEPIDRDALRRCIDGALTGPGHGWRSDLEFVTDKWGYILHATPAGARLLNGTVRGVQNRSLLLYFEHHRDTWLGALLRASAGERMSLTGRIRPKDRRPLFVAVSIERVVDDGWAAVRWTFQSRPSPRTVGCENLQPDTAASVRP